MGDPVFEKEDGSWWHTTEDADEMGPFISEAEARAALQRYVIYLEMGE